MGQSPEALRDEIAGTRQEMSETLEAIGDHVSPGRVRRAAQEPHCQRRAAGPRAGDGLGQ